MKRIVVLGAPGVGKSTFSRQLSEITGLPVQHLDYYFHDKKTDYEHHKDEWVSFTESLASKPEWISDGNYRPTLPARLRAADVVIFLDYPRWRALYCIFTRRYQFRNKKRADMPDDWEERLNWLFFKFVWKFNGAYRDDLMAAVKNAKPHKLYVFTHPKQVDVYLQSLSN